MHPVQVCCTKVVVQIALKLCKQVALLFCYICIVKVLGLIMSLFLFGLSLAPCQDEPDIFDIEISHQADSEDPGSDDAEDLCSPLCVCHCCHSHLVVSITFFNKNEAPLPISDAISYTDLVTKGFVGSLFQPPQV